MSQMSEMSEIHNYLLGLIKERNKKELLFKPIISHYRALIKSNQLLQIENTKLKHKIDKSLNEIDSCSLTQPKTILTDYFLF